MPVMERNTYYTKDVGFRGSNPLWHICSDKIGTDYARLMERNTYSPQERGSPSSNLGAGTQVYPKWKRNQVQTLVMCGFEYRRLYSNKMEGCDDND